MPCLGRLVQRFNAWVPVMRCSRALFAAASASNHLAWPKHQFPTPYDIFHLDQGASSAEIKRRYYELVKIYHPDRIDKPTAAENERFHKIVAANDLLCDRTKRSAFDSYGVGWQWTNGSRRPNHVYAGQTQGSRFNRYNRSRRADHAETEEWDNFYTGNKTRAAGKETMYTSNTNFIGFIVFLSAIGAVVQAARLGKASAEINERAEKHHLATVRDLAESRRLARNLDKDERRRLFLAHRSGDAAGYGVLSSDDDTTGPDSVD